MFAFLIIVSAVSSLTCAENMASLPSDQDNNYCFLPLYPEHGSYTVRIHKQDRYSSVKLHISCDNGYLNNSTVKSISCVNGEWTPPMPTCVLDLLACGLTTQHRQLEGTSNNQLELPWHVVIYEKRLKSYYQTCGGSLITATKIISSAHCFYHDNDKLRPASDFKVAVNKMYYEYNDTHDRNNQYSDVDEIITSSNYQDSTTRYENNIAIVVVKRAFFFHLSVRPVCLDFDNDLDSTQLTDGNSGKTVSWSPVVNNGDLSFVLNVVNISYMKNEDCNTIWPTYNREYVTKNKFCARNYNRSGMIDYGSGVAFLESTTQRYYLRGVRSNIIMDVHGDQIFVYTSIMKHANFIKQHL